MRGKLIKEENFWSVITDNLNFTKLPIHPKYNFWLNENSYYKGGEIIEFEVVTIAVGESEFDVIDTDVAIIKI